MSTTDRARELEKSIARLAVSRGVAAYLVGGVVRDRLRRRVPRDMDVAILGDAIGFARAWARLSGAEVEAAPAFGTASAIWRRSGKPFRVDFSSTRGETYRHPGALPDVFPSGIEDDLARRDFTVNAMAIPLFGPNAGRVLDPFGGREDLRRKRVRMLHPRSPHDDPTRAFRAVRLALRLGFRIAPETRRWIAEARASGAFSAVSGDRLRRELRLLFEEQPPLAAVSGLSRAGLDRAIHPSLAVGAAIRRRLRALETVPVPSPEERFWAAIFSWSLDFSPESGRAAADRLQIAGARREELLGSPGALRAAAELVDARASDSALAALSRRWSAARAAAIASALPAAGRARFLAARRRGDAVKLEIGGSDLRRSGLRPGPGIGRALELTWRARVDRRIGRADELRYALEEASR